MVMLTWFSSPIFASNLLTPSLLTPDGGGHADHHHTCNQDFLHSGGAAPTKAATTSKALRVE